MSDHFCKTRNAISGGKLLGAATVASAILLCAAPAGAQVKSYDRMDDQLRSLMKTSTAKKSKLAPQASLSARTGPASYFEFEPLPMRMRDGMVLIDAVAESDAATLKRDLARLGAEGVTHYGRTVSGWVPVAALSDMNVLKSLRFARPSYATTNVGLTTSQGDAAMRSDRVKSQFGIDGTGVKVGVISDTFDNRFAPGLTDYAADIANGDLPAGVEVLAEGVGAGIDEGRAMAQLIYDVAPGTDLAFHSAFNGLADFAIGIEELGGCPGGSEPQCGTTPGGASAEPSDVIVDDIIYFAEPMFQDGIIAKAADTVANAGIPYYSSNGNQERLSWEGGFNPGPTLGFFEIADCGIGTAPPPIFPSTAHDFDPGPGVDIFQEFTINPGEGVGEPFVFQWDEPYFSFLPAASTSPGSLSDYDIYLVLTDAGDIPLPTPCVLQGSAAANLFGDPLEIMNGIGLGAGATSPIKVGILVTEFIAFDGQAGLMKWVSFGGNSPDEYDTRSATGYGHSNAAGAEGVGAAWYLETPEFGVNPPLIEPFSSAGGTPILFDVDGNRLPAPEVRLKPGVTAPDGTNTTFFGFDVEGDGFPNFFGTSAAAPHAAAVAALMLQTNAGLSTDEVYDLKRDTAIDMDDPATPGFDVGFDFGTGFGLVDAFLAVDAAATDPRNAKKRLVCKRNPNGRERTLSISVNAVPAFIRRGDKFGPCD